MRVPVSFQTVYRRANKILLVDSGATDNFMDPRTVKHFKLGTQKLGEPQKIWNIDGTNNKAGMITDFIDLNIQVNHETTKMRFLIMDLGIEHAILGYPWLAWFEPNFRWKEGIIDTNFLPIIIWSLNWDEQTKQTIAQIVTEPITEAKKEQIVEELWEECSTTASIATKLAQDAKQYTKEVPIPAEYQQHWKVFSEEESHWFPPSQVWDHVIDLKEGAPPKFNCKLIPMTPTEDEVLQTFLKEQTDKGYIRELKSPYTSAFFFIKRKDGKLCPIQDYQKLNGHTIKNRYLLPLIPDLIAEVQNTWVFTKFDIRWGYNNVRIKKGDEHKAAFKTKYGLFEPRVMFFRLTNSPATFQAMTNKILRVHQEKVQALRSGYQQIYGQLPHCYQLLHRSTSTSDPWLVGPNWTTWPLYQTGKMCLGSTRHRLSGANPWKGGSMHGPC